jgi:aspartyl-tRNA(Asn)/glutamyl-tRNA(Gln) amidotransferase subunit A
MDMGGTAAELASAVNAGRASAVAVCQAALAHLATEDGRWHAFLSIDAEHALAQAAHVDAAVAAGRGGGPLAGVPVGVKDNICTRFGHTTCGSRMLATYASPYDATAVARIESAGGIILGKTNLDEFAMGSSTETSAFGPTHNPWNADRVPGGSSGGSAAAVAASLVPLALGSDTGGSIRQPAAFCGVVGLTPTYGRVSRHGLVAHGSSFDQIGPLARNVLDTALLLQVIAGFDEHDATSATATVPDYSAALRDSGLTALAGQLRVGVISEFADAVADEDTRAALDHAVQVFRNLGARTTPVSLPSLTTAVAAYYLIATAEASSNLARFDGVHYGHRTADALQLAEMSAQSRAEGFGAEVKRRIMLGTYVLSAGYDAGYYQQAVAARRHVRCDFERALRTCDVLLAPTTPEPAFELGARCKDPLAMYLSDAFTTAASLAGLPALSLPAGLSQAKLPLGLQLIGPPFGETILLQAARLYERATKWPMHPPPAGPADDPGPDHAATRL